jgi:lipopolysaccharide/colanic/teichoic acid biosynthesis glycosyltransferase
MSTITIVGGNGVTCQWGRVSDVKTCGCPRGRSRFARAPDVTTRKTWALAVKRGIDLVGAAAVVVALSPVLAWTTLGVAVTQGRPIFFRQERPGLHGRPFEIVKFRSMRPPRRGEVWYMTDEQRISRLGRFLRSTSIDELPELWNVLRGEMSLVGPRPLLMEYLPTYTTDELRRHDMRPGITGWAAVNGRHTLKFEDRLRLDVWYVDQWSLWLDLKIIAMTTSQVLHRTDVAATQNLNEVGFRLPGVGNTTAYRPGDGIDGVAGRHPRSRAC